MYPVKLAVLAPSCAAVSRIGVLLLSVFILVGVLLLCGVPPVLFSVVLPVFILVGVLLPLRVPPLLGRLGRRAALRHRCRRARAALRVPPLLGRLGQPPPG